MVINLKSGFSGWSGLSIQASRCKGAAPADWPENMYEHSGRNSYGKLCTMIQCSGFSTLTLRNMEPTVAKNENHE